VFVLALIIVSIVTAAKNSRSDAVGGKAAAFTAIWILLVLLFVMVSSVPLSH
jgi:hypothetical protein